MSNSKGLKVFWPVLFIAIITAIFFYPVWLKKQIPLPVDALVGIHVPWTELKWPDYPAGIPFKNGETTDSISQFYPWRSLVGEFWRQAEFPLWNPYMFSGMPLLATIHSAALYPLNIIYLFFSDSSSWTGLLILQILLSGIFMYLFLKRLNLPNHASTLGATIFAFSGYMIMWLEFATGGHAGLWLPLLLLMEINLFESLHYKWLLPIAIIFFFILSAGDFQVPVYIVITYLLFGIYLIGWQDIKNLRFLTRAIMISLGLVFGVLLALPQILPAFELFGQSMRGSDPYIRDYYFGLMDWVKITNFIWPDFYGNVTTGNYWGRFDFKEYICFTGVISVIFATYSSLTKKINRESFFIFLLVLSLLFLFPTPFGFLPYNLNVPALSTSAAGRIIFLVDFCLAVLAAFGFSKWSKNQNGRLIFINYFLVILTLLTATILVTVIKSKSFVFGVLTAKMAVNLNVSLRNLAPTTAVLVSLTLLLVIGKYILPKLKLKTFGKVYSIILPFLIIILAGAELLRFSWKYVSFSPIQFLYPKTKTIEFLQQQDKPFRITGGIPTNLFMPYQLSSAEGYDSIYPLRYAQWVSAIESGQISTPRRRYGLISNYLSPLLNYNNVEYVIDYKKGQYGDVNKDGSFEKSLLTTRYQQVYTENRVGVFQNTDNLPKVWLSANYVVINEPQKIIDELENKQNQRDNLIILEQEPEIQIDKNKIVSNIFNYKETNTAITLNIDTSENALLFLSQTYYPGWRAYVDKKETPVMRSNYTFQTIAVPKGGHAIELVYRPKSFLVGLAVSLITFIALILHLLCTFIFPKRWVLIATLFSKNRRI